MITVFQCLRREPRGTKDGVTRVVEIPAAVQDASLALFYLGPRVLREYVLLAASYSFYAAWNYMFIALLLVLTAIDYTTGIWLEKVRPGPRRKFVLIMSLGANLGFLGFFKYFNFLAANLALLAGIR